MVPASLGTINSSSPSSSLIDSHSDFPDFPRFKALYSLIHNILCVRNLRGDCHHSIQKTRSSLFVGHSEEVALGRPETVGDLKRLLNSLVAALQSPCQDACPDFPRRVVGFRRPDYQTLAAEAGYRIRTSFVDGDDDSTTIRSF